ncbi:polysaccharide biosynthesis tyrosine autokinase [Rhodobacter capsulatus]|uniref:polysaccharide biosynthesis tyrosine autokinase n=1 Tax=Rhodobacter capsulatus TaxID=1061 RepID=UPI0006DC7920|nr:polysaccharide biosynthesis tyrosine autokinase [Rhodobacter capsulatus]KQB17267.1 acetyltransferase [Rhodobacter capsulatus]KQB17668.1 acetyltransferase [Rhodobacter capsulatus]PZX27336.1 tyrosine-protein kinase Etk/Wzc [Rhodobacter capsulatus]QNR64420.1 polysaccharide biosynthesis tyrosine autokinase [Rhodobacter capsulatus]
MTSTAPRPTPEQTDEIDLMELAAHLWAGKLWIAGITAAALALGVFSVLRATPVYQAEGLLQLEAKSGALALPEGMQELLSGDLGAKSPGEAEMAIMKSRMVMSEVVQGLNLQIVAEPRPWPVLGMLPVRLGVPDLLFPAFQHGNEAIAISVLDLPEALLGEDLWLRITAPGEFRLTLPDGAVLEGPMRRRLSLPEAGVTILVDRLEGPVGREFLVSKQALPDRVQELQENFAVAEAPKGSSILKVSYRDPVPERAERILDAIAQAYVSQNVSRSAAEARNSLDFIDAQLPKAEVAVAAAQDALNAYRQAQQSVDVDYETKALLDRATQIETELNALTLKEEELKDRFTINHPVYLALLQNRATLEAQLAELRKTTANLPETQKEIFNLSRNLEVAQQVYVQLLNRQQELRVVQASTVGSVRIIDTAYASDIKVSPRAGRIMAVALLLGLVLGAAAVFGRRLLNRGIRGAQELEKLGLPVFATVNFSPEAANHRRRKGALPIMALSNPDDLVIEALRSLRTSLHFGMLDARTNTVLITSAAPGAGKSFTSVNFAAVAAQAGQRVCLVDADLRKGYLRRYFGLDRSHPGLSDYLARERTLEEVLTEGPIAGLSVITSGRFPPNPSELLMRAEFEALLQALSARFDLVIIDSPPALAVTDPVVIGRFTGARIVVARHLETMAGEIEAVKRAFETAGSTITGAILNGYKVEEGARYGGAHHYYNYRYDYKSDRR